MVEGSDAFVTFKEKPSVKASWVKSTAAKLRTMCRHLQQAKRKKAKWVQDVGLDAGGEEGCVQDEESESEDEDEVLLHI